MQSTKGLLKKRAILACLGILGVSLSAKATLFKVTEIPVSATPSAINNSGQVVLQAHDKGLFWSKQTGVIELDSYVNGSLIVPADINDAGIILGINADFSSPNVDSSYVPYWVDYTKDISTVYPKSSGDYRFNLSALNNQNIMVGQYVREYEGICRNAYAMQLNLSNNSITEYPLQNDPSRTNNCYHTILSNIAESPDFFAAGSLSANHDTTKFGGAIYFRFNEPQGYYSNSGSSGNISFPSSVTTALWDSVNRRYYVAYRQRVSTSNKKQNQCVISYYTEDGSYSTTPVKFGHGGTEDQACVIDAMNKDFAVGKIDTDSSLASSYRQFIISNPISKTNIGWSDISDIHDSFNNASANWEVHQFYDMNGNSQILATALLNGSGIPVPVIIEPIAPEGSSTPNVSVSGQTISLNWNAERGADEYQPQQSYNGGSWQSLSRVQGSAVSYSNKSPGTYKYRISACNDNGCSDYSNSSSTVTVSEPSPEVPTGLHASVSGTTIHIDWDDMDGASEYYRQVRINGGSWQNRTRFIVSQATYYNQQSRSYSYRVQACNNSGCSEYSEPSNTVTVKVPTKPSAPVASVSGTTIIIDWDDIDGASEYYRQVSINGGGWQNRTKFAVSEATYYNQQPRSYRYRVQACNVDGCSDYSTASNSVTVN